MGPPASRARRAWAVEFGALVAADLDTLATLADEEISKPSWELMAAEVMPLVASCRWHGKRAHRVLRDRRLRDRPWWLLGQRSAVVRVPFGRVGIIAPWNYPVQLLGVQLVQAVVAGNRVVVKPSERVPRTQGRLLELAAAAGLDSDELEVRPSDREAGEALLRDSDLDHVVFTGSTQVGRRVAEACATRLVPSTLELSGCDSVVVMPDGDPVLAAKVAWAALTMNHGQTCMAPRRILVHESLATRFAEVMVPLAAGAPPRALADVAAARRHHELVADAVGRGARLASLVPDRSDAAVVRAQVALDCPVDATAFSAEHFGPLMVTHTWRTEAELLDLHQRGGKQLATSVFTADDRRVRDLLGRLGGGMVTTNDAIVPFAHPGAPLAPVAQSGWGVSQGLEGLLSLTRPVVVSRTGRIRVPVGEPDDRAKKMLRTLVRRWGRGASPPAPENESRD